MQKIFENWKRFVNENALSKPTVKLYHYCGRYCPGDPGSVVLEPQMGADAPQSYSRRDYDVLQVPRIWFYLDPADRESSVTGPLYSVEVPTSQIYNLREDERDFIGEIQRERQKEKYFYGTVKQPLRKGEDWNNLFYLIIDKGYKGVYYKTGFDVVVWLEPIEVTLEKKEEK